ncbi:hypothetical protein BDV37DRAFT_290056 [Aspergillus pseudonomiae]|uniref:Uncharacterized protein n=1 Tax=Aspergillus pseudonomiae TaxID=1506151 RepID=A0A5N7CRJ3_9EURO|nr:uncharacterized protein BDV37DRAFT_290056 [Aspergillus pseudonomiae]KAE8396744.1 hypothetical protein BDV37DRAFT_290056 [Aspergillus pseudonomiae]
MSMGRWRVGQGPTLSADRSSTVFLFHDRYCNSLFYHRMYGILFCPAGADADDNAHNVHCPISPNRIDQFLPGRRLPMESGNYFINDN